MKLHMDKDAFSVIIGNVSERTSIRKDIIEKDYYVVLMLFELARKQSELPAYFKGGTALYKALKTLNRFSEDIDLTVAISDCSRSQGKARLERASTKYTVLQRTTDKEKEINAKGSITTIYDYQPITAIDTQDELQRFGHVKVEATSFTVSEPYETSEIEPLLYTKATEEEKLILKEQFAVVPFPIKSIKQERIFADKILAAEFYYQRNELFDVSKHLYDLTVMMGLPRIQEMLSCHDELVKMLSYKRQEELLRKGSELADLPFENFTLFNELEDNRSLQMHFMKMQEIYVFDEKDVFCYEEMSRRMKSLNEILLTLDEGLAIINQEPQMNMY
ncbi:MAG: nucleotidyl transferase AbiEii/AbiGii toxin family protein [Eubacteriales bacterium]